MSSILDHESDVIAFRKLYPSSDVVCTGGLDGVGRRSAQLARWIRGYRSIDRGACINKRIAVPNWGFWNPIFVCPIGSNPLTLRCTVGWAVVAWFGERLVLNKLSLHCRVEGVPFGSCRPAIVYRGLSRPELDGIRVEGCRITYTFAFGEDGLGSSQEKEAFEKHAQRISVEPLLIVSPRTTGRIYIVFIFDALSPMSFDRQPNSKKRKRKRKLECHGHCTVAVFSSSVYYHPI